MQIPEKLLLSLEGIKGFNRASFQELHDLGEQVTSVRLNPQKIKETAMVFPSIAVSSIPWAGQGFYLSERPSFTFDPLFHAGCYYVQEASSMFLEQALTQNLDLSRPLKILDLSAAPGGKSTHLQSLVSEDSLLVSNEVIRSRANILKDNIVKWGANNVVVTNNDPKDFSALENYFDVIVVDAPCSGSGLFRRDPDAITEWSENNVMLCSQRQQRILADVLPALKQGGLLIYSTCSYSKEENEDIITWLKNELNIDHSPLAIDPDWGIIETDGGYRFWPDRVKGEGFFMACFVKKEGKASGRDLRSSKKISLATKNELKIIEQWTGTNGKAFIKNNSTVYAIAEHFLADINFLLSSLRVMYSGTIIGELIRDKLVPAHELALSNLYTSGIPYVDLDKEQAINYLKRKDINIQEPVRGWNLVRYKGQNIGWINVLPNRINNYYPKELRILKDG